MQVIDLLHNATSVERTINPLKGAQCGHDGGENNLILAVLSKMDRLFDKCIVCCVP